MKVPKPPLVRIIKEGSFLICPLCGSSMTRRFIFFGKKTCIQPECENNELGKAKKVEEYIEEKGW